MHIIIYEHKHVFEYCNQSCQKPYAGRYNCLPVTQKYICTKFTTRTQQMYEITKLKGCLQKMLLILILENRLFLYGLARGDEDIFEDDSSVFITDMYSSDALVAEVRLKNSFPAVDSQRIKKANAYLCVSIKQTNL